MSLTQIIWIAGIVAFFIVGIWITTAISRWAKNFDTLLELKNDVSPSEVKVELEPLLSPLDSGSLNSSTPQMETSHMTK